MDILLVGATGAMGRTITSLVQDTDHKIVAGVSDELDHDMGYPLYEDFNSIEEEYDLIIDFSTPFITNKTIDLAVNKSIPVVIGTTGHEDRSVFEDAADRIPVLQAGNMSVGINVAEYIVEQMAKLLEGFDIEIVESHHRNKIDSPSGTARMLFDSANKGRENSLTELDGRAGIYEGGRTDSEVGISAIRGGSIVGEHSVIFAGVDEVLTIKHTAYSKKIFGAGAIKAAEFLVDKEPGLYDMDDVLEIVND